MDSIYRGNQRFDREQLVFMVDCILIAALDRIEESLPHNGISALDRAEFVKEVTKPSYYEYGGLETAGMALAVLYAQLTNDGLGIYDALTCANNFHKTCEQLVENAWMNDGKAIRQRMDSGSKTMKELYGNHYPDTRYHAEMFVDNVFTEYLK